MKILLDLDPRDVWRIQERAARLGITPGDVLRDDLISTRKGRESRDAVMNRVLGGMCDADIAAELRMTPGHVATVRRRIGLAANPRYSAARCVNGHGIEDTSLDAKGRPRCVSCARDDNRRRRVGKAS